MQGVKSKNNSVGKKKRKNKNKSTSTTQKTKKSHPKNVEESVSISSSLFGGNSDAGSLSSSIFGNGSSASTSGAQSSLFGSPDKWKEVSEKRVKKNTDVMSASDSKIGKHKEDATKLSKSQIMEARKNHSKLSEVIKLTESVTIRAPKNVHSKTFDDSEKDDVFRGVLNMFTINCDALFRENGVVIIKSEGRMIRKMAQLTSQAANIESQICHRLTEKGNIFHVADESASISTCASEKGRAIEQSHSFQYNEVASRCLGRLDVRYKMNEKPFNEDEVVSNKFLMPVIHSLLGKDAKLVYAGLILSFPLSADQPWHQDGTALFEDKEFPTNQMLPPYAINVFIPLEDVTEELGPTEFCVGSHYRDKGIQAMKYLENGKKDGANIISPLLKAGDALLYDYRICHRGTQNLAENTTRPMLYLMYSRPWFSEHINFSDKKLFDS